MKPRFIVSGTDTGIGKTIFAAALTDALDGCYWKPVQSGLEEETDSQAVARLGGIPAERILPEAYRLATPASPHLAARLDGVEIDTDDLTPPACDLPLVIEGAGGVLVPLTERMVFADVFARWRIPLILCTRTTLGTINHTLLSLEALKARAIDVFGVVFIGDENAETQRVTGEIGGTRSLGRLPRLRDVNRASLRQAFRDNFDVASFEEVRL